MATTTTKGGEITMAMDSNAIVRKGVIKPVKAGKTNKKGNLHRLRSGSSGKMGNAKMC